MKDAHAGWELNEGVPTKIEEERTHEDKPRYSWVDVSCELKLYHNKLQLY